MPLSLRTVDALARRKVHHSERRAGECIVAFAGFNYPPRSFFLNALSGELRNRGITLTVHGDKRGRSNEEYWGILSEADVIVTTTMQGPDRSFIDWNWIRQAVHRFSETFATQTALVAAPVDGGFPPFVAGRDYFEFGSVNEAADAIEYLANNPDARERIARQGHVTLRAEVERGTFWTTALGHASDTP